MQKQSNIISVHPLSMSHTLLHTVLELLVSTKVFLPYIFTQVASKYPNVSLYFRKAKII